MNLQTGPEYQASDVVAVANGVLIHVHEPEKCVGTKCWVHDPSTHSMNSWPISWRRDRGTAERLCPHSVGHPDPDVVSYNASVGRDVSIHACDGCCAPQS